MSGNACILLIAERDDAEAGLVAESLGAHGIEVCWIDTADFPGHLDLIATPGAKYPGWLRSPDGEINLAQVRSVYRRSPSMFGMDDGMSAPERRFALMEAVQGMGGALASLRCRWMNHPARVADASYKPLQLCVADQCGLRVPRTLVTNVGQAAREFAAELGGSVIYKPMSPGVLAEQRRIRVVNATLITSECIDDAAVGRTAHTFQQWIDKEYDARVTAVGGNCFGVAIYAATETARIDWRSDYDALSYVVVDVPAEVQDGINDYLARCGLLFAALDFAVETDGAWWFLEANANGLWAWLQERTGLPISDAIAALLVEEDTR
ncbi:MAG TPA: ATP-grasp ribosomal peptide maturase [Pseudonocardiaceae bacterium]|nr:ATP-grasp ribosomal peptide maturase [Pseudonocardiaceae bacterium]